MILNKNITVINEFNGRYYSFYIEGVSFIGKTAKTVTEKGLNTSDYFICRIPHKSIKGEYISPLKWRNSLRVIHITTESGIELMTEQGFTLDAETTVNELVEQYLQAENSKIIQAENGEPIEIGKNNRFTFIPQKTFIALGKVNFEDLKDIVHLFKNHDVYTITSVKDNRFGSPHVRHWRCDCK